MRLTSIALYNDQSTDPLVLSFKDPSSENPFQAAFLGGLDADEIMWGNNDSGYEAKLRKRDVVVRVGLNPRWSQEETYSSLRDQLYRIIQSTRSGEISIAFLDGADITAVLIGRVVKMEAGVFSKTPEMQLTIECKNPLLMGPELTVVNTAGLVPASSVVTDLLSTAPHGAILAVKFLGAASTFELSGDDWSFKTTPVGTGGFQINDVLVCSSVIGLKGLVIKRGSSNISIVDSIHAKSIWPIIFPGENTIECSGSVAWESIKYPTAYWGI